MARVLVGVTGGIAAYKACELVRLLVRAGHEVFPLVTPGAERFVRAETFFALARRSPAEDLYLHLTRADLLVVAPLTANTLAKLAAGEADNIVAEVALAHRGPVLLAPAMNPRMWAHAATQANVEMVRARGATIVGPEEGETAEGEWGWGRMAEPEEIFRRCRECLGESDSLVGRHVLVSAGGTREPLDAVRFLGNRSSGRMGVALAEQTRKRGAAVTLLAAKRPKDEHRWQVELEPTADVLAELGRRRTGQQVLVGFAAETTADGLARAREKLERKRIDLVVYNDVSRGDIGFEAEENEVVLVSASGERRLPRAPKDRIAAAIVDSAEELLRERAP